jgi:dipeptidyl aminopeptidase/acylaminoacyl peptidase
MTIFLIIIIGLVIIVAIIFGLMLKSYKNHSTPHNFTPAKFNIAFEEISIPVKNNRQLYGWWIPAQTDCVKPSPVIILVHGWNRNVERMLPYIKRLHPIGYHLLAFDSRNHGSSDTDGYSSMLKFAEDIMAAIDFLKGQPCVDHNRIGVTGLSIGGAASIYAAAKDHRIKSVITVGAFTHPLDIMKPEFEKRHIPYFPIVWAFLKYVELRIGASFRDIAPINNINNARAQMLLIHGDADITVPVEQAERLKNAGNPKNIQLWIVPGKGHSNCNHHPEFWGRVEMFLRNSLD